MTSTLDEPRTGPYVPWVKASDVLQAPALADFTVSAELAADMAMAASECLYGLSGRQYTGAAGPVTVRPVARPTDIDTRFGHRGVPNGYQTAGQATTAYGMPGSGAVNYFGTSKPSEVELYGYPVTGIDLVKIDGIVIPPNEYYVQDRRTLVRRRPSASATPTERYGWPVNQLLDLPDTEPGTFSVTYRYGVAPPQLGVNAASVLAVQLVLNALNQANSLPQRITSISRQGVSVSVVDVMDFLKDGLTGIWSCDIFIRWANPTGARLPSLVWSPDVGRARRMPASGN
ncbi:MAG: hypothetical protein KGH75_00080 [Rhodospirillales bacterium]|nr:hypothetical protein [Rhodospirillales bacterium]